MTLRQYLAVMTISTLMCWAALVIVIINVDPFQANWLSFGFFYLSLFLSLSGTFALLFFWLFYLARREMTPLFRRVARSFRSGLLAALSLTGLVYFLGRGWLQVWNMVIFLAALVSLIIFLLFQRRARTASGLTDNSNLI